MRFDHRALRLLTVESLRDASRRRIVPAALVLSLLCLATLESCTSCSANVVVGGQAAPIDVLSWAGMLSFAVLAFFVMALAGLLASDHLRAIFDDGSAILLLARPISRATFALARLAGALAVALASATILCGGAIFLLVVRGGLPLAPAFAASAAVVVSSVTVAALAMLGSLFLPRLVTVLAVLGGLAGVAVLNLASASGRELGGLFSLVDSFGPPLFSTVILALSPWSGQPIETISAVDVVLRSAVWGVASLVLLLVAFDQRDVTALERG